MRYWSISLDLRGMFECQTTVSVLKFGNHLMRPVRDKRSVGARVKSFVLGCESYKRLVQESYWNEYNAVERWCRLNFSNIEEHEALISPASTLPLLASLRHESINSWNS